MKTVLIIAGSDPGAGAGLQQDLKTATLLGVYGLTVVTALTVQNSLGVQAVNPLDPEVVAAQLEAVLSDFPVAAIKIGLLGRADTVSTVARRFRQMENLPPLVLDPVLASGHGQTLLSEDGLAGLQAELFPLAEILTPNLGEAARLTGMEITTAAHLAEAARRLQALGPRWVLAKGGHLPGEPVDILTDGRNTYELTGARLNAPHHHGSGCLLATALAACLAQGLSVPEAVNRGRDLVRQALRYGLPLGQGVGPVNPYAPFARQGGRYEVLEALRQAARRLQEEDISPLIPEVMSNLGYAAPYAAGPEDVAAFPGRLLKSPEGVIIPAAPAFGVSRRLAAVILTAIQTYPELRAGLNLKWVQSLEDLAPLLNFKVVRFDRGQAPPQSNIREDGLLSWGVASVLQAGQTPPDIICAPGDFGQEPLLYLLGPAPMAVAEKALALKYALQAADRS